MQTEKVAILFNPSAGKGKALRKKNKLEKLLRRLEISYDLFVTRSEEDLKELTKEKSTKFNTIIGAGGDSTFNIIVNEIIKNEADVTFGMISLGSSNDITREFGIHSLEEACLALIKRKTHDIDLGCIIKEKAILRYYIGQANIGLGVLVNKYVHELENRKSSLGKIQTIAGTMGVVNSYLSKKIPFPLTVESEKEKVEGIFLLANFSNIRYWATGRKVSPFALPDDNQLDCCLINACSFAQLAHLVFLSKKGKHSRAKNVKTFQSKYFNISSEKAFEIQTDGEIIESFGNPSKFKKIELKVIPQKLNIIC